MKHRFVDDYHLWWKFISIRCMILAAVVQEAWSYIPDDLRQSLPNGLAAHITEGLLILGVCGRLLKQGDSDGETLDMDHNPVEDAIQYGVGNRGVPRAVSRDRVSGISSKKSHRPATKKPKRRPF